MQTVARVIVDRLGRDAGRTRWTGAFAAEAARAAARHHAPPRRGERAAPTETGEVGAARSGRVQRYRRVHPRRPRVRHHDHRGRADARAVGERARQSVVRQRRQRERRRVHLVRERPRLSADALAQRSGQRRQRRGASICATRRTAGSGRRRRSPVARGRAVHHPPRLRLQRLRVHRGRHLDRAARRTSRPTRR